MSQTRTRAHRRHKQRTQSAAHRRQGMQKHARDMHKHYKKQGLSDVQIRMTFWADEALPKITKAMNQFGKSAQEAGTQAVQELSKTFQTPLPDPGPVAVQRTHQWRRMKYPQKFHLVGVDELPADYEHNTFLGEPDRHPIGNEHCPVASKIEDWEFAVEHRDSPPQGWRCRKCSDTLPGL